MRRVVAWIVVVLSVTASIVGLLDYSGIQSASELLIRLQQPLDEVVINIRHVPGLEHLSLEARERLTNAGARVDHVLTTEWLGDGVWVAYRTRELHATALLVAKVLAEFRVDVEIIPEATERYSTRSADEDCVLVIGNPN